MLCDVYKYMATSESIGRFPTDAVFDILREADLTCGNKDAYHHINECLIRMSISRRLSIRDAYSLISDPYLYEYLDVVKIHQGYFMVALGNYIICVANLNRDLLFKASVIANAEPQKIFNSVSQRLIETLEVFYD